MAFAKSGDVLQGGLKECAHPKITTQCPSKVVYSVTIVLLHCHAMRLIDRFHIFC
jgi:hypothetical protein